MLQFDEDDEEGGIFDQDSYNVANMSSVSCSPFCENSDLCTFINCYSHSFRVCKSRGTCFACMRH